MSATSSQSTAYEQIVSDSAFEANPCAALSARWSPPAGTYRGRHVPTGLKSPRGGQRRRQVQGRRSSADYAPDRPARAASRRVADRDPSQGADGHASIGRCMPLFLGRTGCRDWAGSRNRDPTDLRMAGPSGLGAWQWPDEGGDPGGRDEVDCKGNVTQQNRSRGSSP